MKETKLNFDINKVETLKDGLSNLDGAQTKRTLTNPKIEVPEKGLPEWLTGAARQMFLEDQAQARLALREQADLVPPELEPYNQSESIEQKTAFLKLKEMNKRDDMVTQKNQFEHMIDAVIQPASKEIIARTNDQGKLIYEAVERKLDKAIYDVTQEETKQADESDTRSEARKMTEEDSKEHLLSINEILNKAMTKTPQASAFRVKKLQDIAVEAQRADETNDGTGSTTGFGSFKDMLKKSSLVRNTLKEMYLADNRASEINSLKEEDQIDVLQDYMSENSNQIDNMIKNAFIDGDAAKKMRAVLDIYRASDLTLEQFGDAAYYSITDPTNLVGAGGKIFRGLKGVAQKLLGKTVTKEPVKQLTKGAALAETVRQSAAVGLTAGAADQRLGINAGTQDGYDAEGLARTTALGGLIGGGTHVAASAVAGKLSKKKNGAEVAPEQTKEKILEKVQESEVEAEALVRERNEAIAEGNKEKWKEAEKELSRVLDDVKSMEKEADLIDSQTKGKDTQTYSEEDQKKIKEVEKIKEDTASTEYTQQRRYRTEERSYDDAASSFVLSRKQDGKLYNDRQQQQRAGRSVSQDLDATPNRGDELETPFDRTGATPEEKVDNTVENIMQGYKNSIAKEEEAKFSPIKARLDELEHRRLAYRGLQQLDDSKADEAVRTHIEGKIDELDAEIEAVSGKKMDAEVDFNTLAEFGNEAADNFRNFEESYPAIEAKERLWEDVTLAADDANLPAEEKQKLQNATEQLSALADYELGKRVQDELARNTGETESQIMERVLSQGTTTLNMIKRLTRDKDGNVKNINKIIDTIRKDIEMLPDMLKPSGNGKADTALALRKMAQINENIAIGKITPEKKIAIPKEKENLDVVPDVLDKARKEWEKEEKKTINIKNVLKNKAIREEGLTPKVRRAFNDGRITEEEAASVLAPKRNRKKPYLLPEEIQQENWSKLVARENEKTLEKIFGQSLSEIRKDNENIEKVFKNEIFDAKFQIGQTSSIFVGDSSAFDAMGISKTASGEADARVEIGKDIVMPVARSLGKSGAKQVVKAMLRNYAYGESRNSAIIGLLKEDLGLTPAQATEIYTKIEANLENYGLGALKKYREFFSSLKNIPTKVKIKYPDGTVANLSPTKPAKENIVIGTDAKISWIIPEKEGRSSTLSAQFMQSMDSWLKFQGIKEVKNRQIAGVHDALISPATKKEVKKAFQEGYMRGLQQLQDFDMMAEVKEAVTGVKQERRAIPNIIEKLDPEKMFPIEDEAGRHKMIDLLGDFDNMPNKIMSEKEAMITMLAQGAPLKVNGAYALREAIARGMNSNFTETFSKLDKIVRDVHNAKDLEDLRGIAGFYNELFKGSDKAKISEIVLDTRRALEMKDEFTGKKFMENDMELRERLIDLKIQSLQKKGTGDVDIVRYGKNGKLVLSMPKKKTKESKEPKVDRDQIIKTVEALQEDNKPKEVEEIESRLDKETIKEEHEVLTKKTEEQKQKEEEFKLKKVSDKTNPWIATKKIIGTWQNSFRKERIQTEAIVTDIKRILKDNNIDDKQARENLLDTGYRHIIGFDEKKAEAFKKQNIDIYNKYRNEIEAKSKAFTNPNMRYGYFENNFIARLAEDGITDPEMRREIAGKILQLSSIEAMEGKWDFVSSAAKRDVAEELLLELNRVSTQARDVLFQHNPDSYNDSYLATFVKKEDKGFYGGLVKSEKELGVEAGGERNIVEDGYRPSQENRIGRIANDSMRAEYDAAKDKRAWLHANKARVDGKGILRHIVTDPKRETEILNATFSEIAGKTISDTYNKMKTPRRNDSIKNLLDSSVLSYESKKGFKLLTPEKINALAHLSGINPDEVPPYVSKVLDGQILSQKAYNIFGKRITGVLKQITGDMKYFNVITNIPSLMSSLGATTLGVSATHGVRAPALLRRASREFLDFEQLTDTYKEAVRNKNVKRIAELEKKIDEHPINIAMNEGVNIGSMDGADSRISFTDNIANMIVPGSSENKVFRNVLLKEGSLTGDTLIKAFNYTDAIGRYAMYLGANGAEDAAIRANAMFGDVSLNVPPMVKTFGNTPIGMFSEWAWTTFKGTKNLRPRDLASLTLVGAGVLTTKQYTGIDTQSANPLETVLNIPESFTWGLYDNFYDQHLSEDSEGLMAQLDRAARTALLPKMYNRIINDFVIDEREHPLDKHMLKQIFPQTKINLKAIKDKDGKPIAPVDLRPMIDTWLGFNDGDFKTDAKFGLKSDRTSLYKNLQKMKGEKVKEYKKKVKPIGFDNYLPGSF